MGCVSPSKMVPRDFETLSHRRAERARGLADRYPASSETLAFLAAIVTFQAEIAKRIDGFESLARFREPLVDLTLECAPAALQEAALQFDEASCIRAMEDYRDRRDTTSRPSFFARVLLQPYTAMRDITDLAPSELDERCCPHCGHLPQVATLRLQGHGSALSLVCSLCFRDWIFRRGCCPACGEDREDTLAYYTEASFDYFRLQACESCRRYVHTIDLDKEPAAIADVDELAALPLDVWASEHGYQKLQPNIAGI